MSNKICTKRPLSVHKLLDYSFFFIEHQMTDSNARIFLTGTHKSVHSTILLITCTSYTLLRMFKRAHYKCTFFRLASYHILYLHNTFHE